MKYSKFAFYLSSRYLVPLLVIWGAMVATSAFAVTCSTSVPVVPCDLSSVTYNHYIGSSQSSPYDDAPLKIYFYNDPPVTITIDTIPNFYETVQAGSSGRLFLGCDINYDNCSVDFGPIGSGNYFNYLSPWFVSSDFGNGSGFSSTTRFISTFPAYDTVIASSSSPFIVPDLGYELYYNASDGLNDPFVRIIYGEAVQQDGGYVTPTCSSSSPLNCYQEIDLAEESGFYSFSEDTTYFSQFAPGRRNLTFQLRTSRFFGLWSSVVIATSTRFVYGELNSANEIDDLISGFQSNFASSTDAVADNCNVLSGFSPLACFTGLFVPNSQQLGVLWLGFEDSFLRKAPWGYGYRVYEILVSDTSTTTLPTASFTVPAGLPGAGTFVDFDVWSATTDGINLIRSTEVSSIDGDPFENFISYWRLMWILVFAFWLLYRFMAYFGSGGGLGTIDFTEK